eukprot:3146004-Prymnesium_polylepis.1
MATAPSEAEMSSAAWTKLSTVVELTVWTTSPTFRPALACVVGSSDRSVACASELVREAPRNVIECRAGESPPIHRPRAF